MAHNVKIVIGNNYGDEGKGLLSRYYCLTSTQNKSIVVFFNGSAQRGHTVELKDGTRHVFHHFGAGTFDNVPTYFADTFLIHPMEFEREYMELYDTIKPISFVSPKCQIVTPMDMLIDHITEDYIAETNGREYGSCGFGTWSATDRINAGINFRVKQAWNGPVEFLFRRLIAKWFIPCLASRGITKDNVPSAYKSYFELESWEGLIKRFAKTIHFMEALCPMKDFNEIYNSYEDLIFEGAQGLQLSKDYAPNNGWNTTSFTGLNNPSILLSPYNDYTGEVCYVSRTYLTRHGDGPFKEIKKEIISSDLTIDKTNQPNEFQGSLRYGFANQEEVNKGLIIADSSKMPNLKVVRAQTHCDEFEKINKTFDLHSYSRFAEDIK